jgi:hypothetical protein
MGDAARPAVSDKEWFDVTAELPAEYDSVIPPR